MQTSTISYWIDSTEKKHYQPLKESLKVDIAIIGGGITGITTALLLSEAGKDIAVLEARELAHGATGYTTAKVTSQHGIIYQDLMNSYGEKGAKQYADANEAAIKKIQSIIKRYNIDCDYEEVNSYVYAVSEKGIDQLQKEYDAAQRLELPAAFINHLKLPFEAKAAVRFSGQGMFHPLKYILGMLDALQEKNVPIYENTRIMEVDGEGPYTLKTTEGQTIEANTVIIATKYPILNKKGLYFAKIHVERSYIIGVSSPKIELEGHYINAEQTVRSLRPYLSGNSKLTLIGGGNHPTGECKDTEKPFEELIEFAKKMDPEVEIKYRWSTQDCMTLDNIPYIGKLTKDLPNIYVATGFSKWGMTHSAVAAMIISDDLLGIENPWKDIYDPGRSMSVQATKELLVQGADMAGDILKKILPIKSERLEDFKNDEGKVIELDGQVVGVYKDLEGEIFIVNPTCRHIGCRLSFNTAEKSWDCPCHGSRYTYTGEVIESPAVEPLERIE